MAEQNTQYVAEEQQDTTHDDFELGQHILELRDKLKELNEQSKEVRAELAAEYQAVKDRMRDEELDTLTCGPMVFSREFVDSCKYNKRSLEDAAIEGKVDLEKYEEDNTFKRCKFSAKSSI